MQPDDPHRKPPRAEPLQPDRPGRGSKQEDSDKAGRSPGDAEKLKQQSEDALENVREGYGKS
jgi:hypothetical protein